MFDLKQIIIIVLIFLNLLCSGQIKPKWERSYIVSNNIRVIITKELLSPDELNFVEFRESFDNRGNLCLKEDYRTMSKHYFFYDSLNNLTGEKIILENGDSLAHFYQNFYENGYLTLTTYVEKNHLYDVGVIRDSLIFFYKDGRLTKRTFKSRGRGTSVFGSYYHFLFEEEFAWCTQFKYSYDKDTNYIKGADIIVYDKNNRILLLLKNYSYNFEKRIEYNYLNSKLNTVKIKDKTFLFSYKKGLLQYIELPSSKMKNSKLKVQDFKYEFW